MKILLSSRLIIALILCFGLSVAYADDPAPLAMLKHTSNKMLSELKKNKSRLQGNDQLIRNIVHKVLIPRVDINRMSKLVVGRDYWLKASSSQRKKFQKEFTSLVISTYSVALQNYDQEVIRFMPIRGNISGRRQLQIASVITQGGRQPIRINYLLVKSGSQWKVYDFSVDGISLVQSYRSQFAEVLANSGFNGLLQKLKTHNQKTGG